MQTRSESRVMRTRSESRSEVNTTIVLLHTYVLTLKLTLKLEDIHSSE